jgi:hypothetical protein
LTCPEIGRLSEVYDGSMGGILNENDILICGGAAYSWYEETTKCYGLVDKKVKAHMQQARGLGAAAPLKIDGVMKLWVSGGEIYDDWDDMPFRSTEFIVPGRILLILFEDFINIYKTNYVI